TSEVRVTGAPVEGALAGVLDLEKELVYQFLDSLGIHADARLRQAIGAPPTRDFRALLAFSRAVEFEDQGNADAAVAAYRQALAFAPPFSLAPGRAQAAAAP